MSFWNSIYKFISDHQLGCAFLVAAFIGALPKPGQSWSLYEIFYTFVNTIAVNLPSRGKTMPIDPITVPVKVQDVVVPTDQDVKEEHAK